MTAKRERPMPIAAADPDIAAQAQRGVGIPSQERISVGQPPVDAT